MVAPERYLPSAADEGWHSLKRPYSTVAVQQFASYYRGKYFCNSDGVFVLSILVDSGWNVGRINSSGREAERNRIKLLL